MPSHRRNKRRAFRARLEVLEQRTLLSVANYTFQSLFTFNDVTAIGGTAPNSLVMDSHGNIFGTTAGGGPQGYGTIFKIPAGSTTPVTLASFNGLNGFNPTGPIVLDAHGNIFGTATDGGASLNSGGDAFNDGTIYELHAGASSITALISFTDDTGAHPFGGLTADSAGNLYGTTYDKAGPNDGTVFKYLPASGTLITLYTFSGTDGRNPSGSLVIDPAGNVFGTTYNGGAGSDGEVFAIAGATGQFFSVASFDGDNGANPTGTLLRDGKGGLYGMTSNGGASGDGEIFQIPAGTGSINPLASFNGGNQGNHPLGTLINDAQGNIYGTTANGGNNSGGTVFVLPVNSGTIIPLASFDTDAMGTHPSGGLIMTPGGALIGTTASGGTLNGATLNDGTLFELASLPFGWIDRASLLSIQGWIYDPAAGANPVNVAVFIDGQFITTAAANVNRPGLGGASLNGVIVQGSQHGFNISLNASAFERIAGSHTINIFALTSIGGIVNPLVLTTSVTVQPTLGAFDAIRGATAVGWAYAPVLGTAAATVQVFIDGVQIGGGSPVSNSANTQRDALNGMTVNGVTILGRFHGFSIDLSPYLLGLSPGNHTISVYGELAMRDTQGALVVGGDRVYLLGTRIFSGIVPV